jgi:hypothetical protein
MQFGQQTKQVDAVCPGRHELDTDDETVGLTASATDLSPEHDAHRILWHRRDLEINPVTERLARLEVVELDRCTVLGHVDDATVPPRVLAAEPVFDGQARWVSLRATALDFVHAGPSLLRALFAGRHVRTTANVDNAERDMARHGFPRGAERQIWRADRTDGRSMKAGDVVRADVIDQEYGLDVGIGARGGHGRIGPCRWRRFERCPPPREMDLDSEWALRALAPVVPLQQHASLRSGRRSQHNWIDRLDTSAGCAAPNAAGESELPSIPHDFDIVGAAL